MHPVSTATKSVPPETSLALPLAAVILANVALAFGPWFVRLADTGPVASAFWRSFSTVSTQCMSITWSKCLPMRSNFFST